MGDKDHSTLGSSSRGRAPLPASQVVERLRARTKAAERYELKGEIARGGMGAIQRVFDHDLRRTLAMKVMLDVEVREDESGSQASATSRRSARFLEEAQITGQLDHPGIVPVHEMGLDDQGRLFFTMKLVKGRDLREILDLLREGKEGWNLTRALNVLLRVCEAMAFAHEKGVIHRDLKPANIMVGRFGEVYVMDWGLAKVLGRPDTHDVRLAVPDASRSIVRTERKEMSDVEPDSSLATMDGDVVGTPCYMAPEQAKGRLEDIGPHSDVYSLGSMLYQVLSGQMPYVAAGEKVSPHTVLGLLIQGPPKPLAEIAKRVPDELVAICEKAMARDVRERYPSMLGVAEDLRAFLEGRVVKAHETGAVAEFKKWIARNRGFATAVAAAILAVLALSGAIAWQQVRANEALKIQRDRALEAEQAATSAKTEAESQRDAAKQAQQLADQKTLALSIASAEVERKSYAANISAAAASVRFHDLDTARHRLEACAEGLRGWEWKYLNELRKGAVGEVARFVESTDGPMQRAITVNAVAADASGRILAATADNSRPIDSAPTSRSIVRLFDLERGTTLGDCEDIDGFVLAIAVDAAGNRVAVLSTDRVVRVFDVATRKLITTWTESKSFVRGVAFSPDGKELAYGTTDRSLRIVDAGDGTLARELADRIGMIDCIAYAPDGTRIAAGASDGNVYVWSLADGGALERVFGDRGSPISCLTFSPDSLLIAAGTASGVIVIGQPWRSMADSLREWDIASGRLLNMWHDHDASVNWCGYAAAGRWLVSTSDDSTVRVRDTQYGDERVLYGHAGVVKTAAVVRGTELVSGGADGTLLRWDLGLGEHLGLEGNRLGVARAAFLADGERLASISNDASARVWNARTGEMLQFLGRIPTVGLQTAQARSIDASASGALVAIGFNDGRIHVEDVDRKTPPFDLPADERDEVTALAFSPDGARLAAGGTRGSVRIWDLAKRTIAATLRGNSTSITSLCWSRDGELLFVGTDQSELSQWNVAKIERTALIEKVGQTRVSLDLSSDGRLLLVQSASDKAKLVRTTDLAVEHSIAIEADVSTLRWFDGERRIVAITPSHSIGILDASSGETLAVLRAPEDAEGFAVDPDGRRIAGYFASGTLRVWSSESAVERNDARRAVAKARELARPYVARLLEERHLSQDAALEAIRGDESISEGLRSAASRFVELTRGEKMFLRHECWETCRSPKLDAVERDLALWRALALEAQDPQDDRAVFLEAAARYRLGQFQRAQELLERSAELRGIARVPVDVQGVQALVLGRLGRKEESMAELARMRATIAQNAVQAASTSNQELLREVEAVLRAAP